MEASVNIRSRRMSGKIGFFVCVLCMMFVCRGLLL